MADSTPDGGALCYVLRTGAYSFQGDLRRMIDFGSHGIREESKDAGTCVRRSCAVRSAAKRRRFFLFSSGVLFALLQAPANFTVQELQMGAPSAIQRRIRNVLCFLFFVAFRGHSSEVGFRVIR